MTQKRIKRRGTGRSNWITVNGQAHRRLVRRARRAQSIRGKRATAVPIYANGLRLCGQGRPTQIGLLG
jgi:hypothetical protein